MTSNGGGGARYAMFWDFENMVLSGEALGAFLMDLTRIITTIDGGKAGRLKAECYARWGLIPDATQEALGNFGFHLIQVPKAGDNALDGLLITNALDLISRGACTHFILIASDGDYCTLCAQLSEKHVSVAIIGQPGHFSSDYLNLPVQTYYVGKSGHLLQNAVKDKAAQVQLIEGAMKDAGAALGNLQGLAANAGIHVFSYAEWEEQYRKLETPSVPPHQLAQVLPLEDFFRCFIEVRGFSPSKDYAHFHCGAPGTAKSLADVGIIQKLPPLCVISAPVDPGIDIAAEIAGAPAKKPDPSILLQPAHVQLGRDVLRELLQIHPGYKFVLFSLLWVTLQHRSKELAALNLPATQVPAEFYRKICLGDDHIQIDEGRHQWTVLKQANKIPPPTPGKYECVACNRTFKSAQAFADHQKSGIHQKITCPECNRKFDSAQALATHKRDKHKK